jgi:hypothetical protein
MIVYVFFKISFMEKYKNNFDWLLIIRKKKRENKLNVIYNKFYEKKKSKF